MTTIRLFCICLLLVLWALPSSDLYAQCRTINNFIFVDNANDEGPGSLREAINCANDDSDPNTIRFDIPSVLNQIIYVGETSGQPLPSLTNDRTTIDGSTQSGFGVGGDFTPKIILDGSRGNWQLPVNGIDITGSSCRVYSLEIRNFPFNGIVIAGGDKNIIGAANKGNIIYSCGEDTDDYPMANPSGPYEGSGIYLRFANSAVSSTTIYNNIIGTNEDFEKGLGNEFAGIRSRNNTVGNIIGINNDGQRNQIAFNPYGIYLDNTNNSRVAGNLFFCNDTAGIFLANGSNNGISPPAIIEATTSSISGQAINNSSVEVYISQRDSCPNAACQGSVYLGTTSVSGGIWTLDAPYHNGTQIDADDEVTAITVSGTRSSAFASCLGVSSGNSCADSLGNIVVTNTDDEGEGSLRQAILCANFKPGPNRIVFDIPAIRLDTIFVGSTTNEPLPSLTDDSTFIDGSSQNSGMRSSNKPLIILDGSKANWDIPFNGIFVLGDNCQIHNLELIRFVDDAIDVTNADNVIISDNVLHSNGADQDTFAGVPINTAPWEGSAINMKGNNVNCLIVGNTIGTNYERTMPLPNEYAAINIEQEGGSHTIGGIDDDESNYIAYNRFGVFIDEEIRSVRIFENSFVCNSESGIFLSPGANQNIRPPAITQAADLTISGRGLPDETIQVYAHILNNCGGRLLPCQGNVYIGSAIVAADSSWMLENFENPIPADTVQLTATATDRFNNTSAFSNCAFYLRSCEVFPPGAVTASILPDTCNLGSGSIELEVDFPDSLVDRPYYILDILEKIPPDSLRSIIDSLEILEEGLQAGLLPEGEYCLVIADITGCTDTFEFEINSIGVFVTSAFTFTVDSLTGTFINQSIDATSFKWLVDGEEVSTTTNLSYEFPGSGLYEVCLIAEGICNRDTFCEDVLIILDEDKPLFDIGEKIFTLLDTGQVKIPVTTASFFDMVGFQFTIQLADTLTAKIVGTSDYGLPQMSQSNFTVFNDQLLAQWADFNLNGQTVPDSTVLFNIVLQLQPDAESCSQLTFEDEPTAIQAVRLFNTTAIAVPPRLDDGIICRFESIEGQIARTDSIPVNFVKIFCNGMLADSTGPDGNYSCALLSDSLVITPEKSINPDNGVKTFDLLLIQNHILNLQKLGTPYREIAADASQDGNINVLDLLIIQNIILRLTDNFPNDKSWRFVDADYVFQTNTPLKENWPESIVIQQGSPIPTSADFIGIKLGDVNLDNDPQNESTGDTLFIKSDVSYDGAQHATVRIQVDRESYWRGFQYGLTYDRDSWEVVDVIPAKGVSTNKQQAIKGEGLFNLWYENPPAPTGELATQWAEDDVIMEIHFSRKGQHQEELTLLLDEGFYDESVNSYFERGIVVLDGVSREITTATTAAPTVTAWTPFSPNPFIDELRGVLELSQAGELQMLLTDVNGRILQHSLTFLPAGKHEVQLSANQLNLSPGLYILVMNVGSHTWKEKVVKLK